MRDTSGVGQVSASSQHRAVAPRESGIALIWAILVMLVVFGTVAVAVNMTLVRTDETKDNANRTRSNMWAQAAADDLVQRLQSREIGFDLETEVGPNTNQLFVITPPTTTPSLSYGASRPSARFPNPTSTVAKEMTFTQNGTVYRGWYQVMPIPGVTANPWRGVFRRAAGSDLNAAAQGSVEMLVRAWEEGPRAEPVVARLTFRHASLSRFSLLSDDRMNIGGLGAVQPGGYVHTNNARGAATAITIDTTAILNNAVKITTTQGAITPNPQCAGKCVANVRDVVEFGAAARAFDRTRQLSTSTVPYVGGTYASRGIAHYVAGPLQTGLTTMPSWWADIAGAGCAAGSVAYGRATWTLRLDTVGVPMLNDLIQPTMGPRTGCLAIAEGGGAALFNGDVIVVGQRPGNRPVTIMAQRITSFNVLQDVDGIPGNESTTVTMPASIYLWDVTNGALALGSTSDFNPVGLVAEGGIYFPSFRLGNGNRPFDVTNVAAMAMGSEVSYGPAIISIAAEAGQPGLGLTPAAARAAGYGSGGRLRWTGSIASRRPITFRYGAANNNGCGGAYVGFCSRELTYPPNFIWNSPPGFPTDRDWHLADYKEFR